MLSFLFGYISVYIVFLKMVLIIGKMKLIKLSYYEIIIWLFWKSWLCFCNDYEVLDFIFLVENYMIIRFKYNNI